MSHHSLNVSQARQLVTVCFPKADQRREKTLRDLPGSFELQERCSKEKSICSGHKILEFAYYVI